MRQQTDPPTEALRDGTRVTIRGIRRDDAPRIAAFIKGLSAHSRHLLFLGGIAELSGEALARLCDPDHAHDAALLVLAQTAGEEQPVGLGRYAARDPAEGAEISVAVTDAWQHKGIGTLLIRHLVAQARSHGIRRLYSVDAASNLRMRKLAQHLGFTERTDPEDRHQVIYSLELAAADAAP